MGLDTIELLMAWEEEFGVEITDEEAGAILTVGDARDCILRKLEGQTENITPLDVEAVWRRVKKVTVDHLSISPDKVTANARIVHDLKAE